MTYYTIKLYSKGKGAGYMKRRRLVLLVFVLTIALSVFCLSSCSNKKRDLRFGDYRYTVENEKVTITKYSGEEADITVPESIKGMPVVAIGNSAFHGCKSIKSLIIPDSVLKIDSLAFNKCSNLEHVTLGRGIREIDFSPFGSCVS